MKKIAFVIRLFQDKGFHGGGEKIFYKLIGRFIENGFNVDIYCSSSDIKSYEGISNIFIVNKPYNHLDPEVVEDFYTEVKAMTADKGYDFIISENITPPLDIVFLQGHSVTYRRNKLKGLFEQFLYNFRPVKNKRIKYEQKWLKQGYRRIFTLSNILKNDLIENFNYPEDNISVVYPGVEMPEFIPEEKTESEFSFGLSAPGFKRKGGYIFIKALSLMKNQGYKFKAKVIYQKSRDNLWVKTLVKIYGLENFIEFLPFQKNMQEFYSSIDCLVMPSLEETFGLVALEAMSYKKPSIVSSFTGLSEILKDGLDGLIFDMNKNPSKNLAEKMAFLMDNQDKIAGIIEHGYETAKIYSWDKTYNDLIRELSQLNKSERHIK